MSWIEERKAVFQQALNTALNLEATKCNCRHQLWLTTTHLLSSAFDLFTYSSEIPEIFNDPEIANKLEKTVNVIHSGLHYILLHLISEQNDSAKCYRSALQYFSDKYHGKFTELLSSEYVKELDETIEIYNDPIFVASYLRPKTNLKNVPQSHAWWLKEEREMIN